MRFQITLCRIDPPIWRRIEVPGQSTMWDLHVAIQDAMGWDDCHLHEFRFHSPVARTTIKVGLPDRENPHDQTFPGWKHRASALFSLAGGKMTYIYDFGDNWEHLVELEGVTLPDPKLNYPRCLNGRRACPPEDVGGTGGYQRFLEIIVNPQDERRQMMLRWAGGSFDPEVFDPKSVRFANPAARLKRALA